VLSIVRKSFLILFRNMFTRLATLFIIYIILLYTIFNYTLTKSFSSISAFITKSSSFTFISPVLSISLIIVRIIVIIFVLILNELRRVFLNMANYTDKSSKLCIYWLKVIRWIKQSIIVLWYVFVNVYKLLLLYCIKALI